jgi:hypothetical protein
MRSRIKTYEKYNEIEPYEEEDWIENDAEMVIDWQGNLIPVKDAVWCMYDKAWCLRKDAIWVNYEGFYTTPDREIIINQKNYLQFLKVQSFKSVNEGYRDYNKKIQYNILKMIDINNLQMFTYYGEDKSFTDISSNEIYEILKKHFIGYIIICPDYERYILHVIDWKIINESVNSTGKREFDINIIYNGYYNNNVKTNLIVDNNLYFSKINKIYLIDNIEHIISGRKISDVDPFGEEDWDDDKDLDII